MFAPFGEEEEEMERGSFKRSYLNVEKKFTGRSQKLYFPRSLYKGKCIPWPERDVRIFWVTANERGVVSASA